MQYNVLVIGRSIWKYMVNNGLNVIAVCIITKTGMFLTSITDYRFFFRIWLNFLMELFFDE